MDCCRFYSSDSLRCGDMFYYFLFGETYRNRRMKIIPNEKLYKILSKRLEQYYFFCVIITVIVMRWRRLTKVL